MINLNARQDKPFQICSSRILQKPNPQIDEEFKQSGYYQILEPMFNYISYKNL